MRTPPRVTGIAAGVVLLAGLAGCGGNASSTSTPPATETVTASSSPSDASTSPSATTSTTAPAAPAQCRLADVKVTVSDGDGAMGSVYVKLTITNTSPSPCTTGGYGGVALVDSASHAIGAPAKRDTSVSPTKIVLQPGHRARALLKIGEAGNYDPADCDQKDAAGLQVIVPNETHSVVVKYDATGCAKSGIKLMTLQPYRAG